MSNEIKIIVALGVGLAIGGGIGFYVGERKGSAKMEAEIAGVQNLYSRLRTEDARQAQEDWNPQHEEGPSENDSEESFDKIAVEQGYSSASDLWEGRHTDPNYLPPTPQGHEDDAEGIEQDIREEGEQVRHIRVVNPNRRIDPNDVTQWDRSPEHPYVITEAEYHGDRPELSKISITYYSGDDILADDQQQYIPDPEGTVGKANLQYFGLASKDARMLHIRNERVEADFEVTLNDGKYGKDVLGFDDDEAEDDGRPAKRQVKKRGSNA